MHHLDVEQEIEGRNNKAKQAERVSLHKMEKRLHNVMRSMSVILRHGGSTDHYGLRQICG